MNIKSVRIVKRSESNYWYDNHIGCAFRCKYSFPATWYSYERAAWVDDTLIAVVDNESVTNIVRLSDCRLILDVER